MPEPVRAVDGEGRDDGDGTACFSMQLWPLSKRVGGDGDDAVEPGVSER